MVSSAGNALSLIKAVLDLVADSRTGVLDVRSDGLRTRVYFDDGKPLFAEDDALGETFGRLLMRQGVITNEQFVRVIDEMTRAAMGNSQLRFGEVAVRLGVLTEEQVERGLAEQVCGIVTRALQRGESQWTFETSPAGVKPVRSFALEINPAVLAALRQSSDRSMVADVVAARPEEFVVVAGPRTVPDVRDEGRTGDADTHASRMAAEQTFQKGMALLRDAKTASAAVELRRAAELQPESLEYLLYATWAKARSYREVPTESDQQTLLEMAQKAKRQDPMFAFASYVLGELSLWAGDEASAKKWFYEALRLDPASEAGKQVRILARRGARTPPAPGVKEPPERDTISDAAPVPPARPPVRATTGVQPSPSRATTPSGRWPLLGGVLVIATAAIVIFVVTRKPAPGAGLEPSTPPQPALSAESPPPADTERKDTPAPPGGPAAGPPASDLGPAPMTKEVKAASAKDLGDADPDMGTVVLPSRASGHRIFVDGRRAQSDGTAPLRLRCGPHTIQIGSSGTPESIDLPCRGEVQLQ